MNITQIVNSATTLSVNDLLLLNKIVCQMIKNRRNIQAATIGATFKIGQIVTFNAKTQGIKRIKIEKFNRAGTCVVGKECLADGTILVSNTKWTVANTLCKVV